MNLKLSESIRYFSELGKLKTFFNFFFLILPLIDFFQFVLYISIDLISLNWEVFNVEL